MLGAVLMTTLPLAAGNHNRLGTVSLQCTSSLPRNGAPLRGITTMW